MQHASPLTRRQLLAASGWTAAGLALAACGSGGTGAQPTPGASVGSDLVSLAAKHKGATLSTLSSKQYFEDANKAIDNAFQSFASQTGVTIKNAGFNADEGNFLAKQDAAVKAGNVQDMAFLQGERFVSQLRELGDIVPVTDVIPELEKANGPASDIAKHYLFVDNEWWGIPFYAIGGCYLLRKDWLEEKGIKPDELKSYEELRDAALEISDPGKNRFGWGITVNRSGDGNGFIETVINVYGGAVNDNAGRKVTLESPETIEAVSFIADLYTNEKYKPMLPPGVLSWTDTGNNEAWLANVTGITSNQLSVYAQSKATKNPVYEQTVTVPGFTGPAVDRFINVPGLTAFVIFKGAKQPELAKLVARYMVAGKAFLGIAKASGALDHPAYKNVWTSDPYYLEGDPVFKTIHELVTQQLPIETKTGYAFPQAPSAGHDAVGQAYILTDMMGEIVQKGTKVQEAVHTAHQRVVQTFEQLGIKQ
jgi:multiple sugar transport system substrate-binding protein